ncbi:MAG: S1 RNA-binding domain-containing protein [Chloroflexi bacterium]|nr:S1 RNA-binding domain-containing protein [Chloroflexota bacterium]
MSYTTEKAPTSIEPGSMAELLKDSEPLKSVKRGDIVSGEVMRIDDEGVLVNIGHKSDGIIPPREMRSLTPEAMNGMKRGDTVYAYVIRPDGDEGPAMLSLDRARSEQGWVVLQKALDNNLLVDGVITGYNKGGVVVDVEGVQGFIPLSQLAPIDRNAGDQDQVLAQRVGQRVKAQLLEVNRRRNRVILSERQALAQKREMDKARLLEELQEGQTRRGRVSGISSFGVFVDLGGADGLIHISELAWTQVNSPEEVVKPGADIDVYVLKVDKENKKIALSLRRLVPEPWTMVPQRYEVGQVVSAVVTKLTNFGAFARIEDSIEGLIHISELSDRIIQHPKEVVNVGDQLQLKIIKIEPERKRLGLSLKQAQETWGIEP